MDTILGALIELFENARKDGRQWDVDLTVFANGMRFSGLLASFSEFTEGSGAAVKAVCEGSQEGIEDAAMILNVPVPQVPKIAKMNIEALEVFLHLRVTSITHVGFEHEFEQGEVMRFPLSAVQVWCSGTMRTI